MSTSLPSFAAPPVTEVVIAARFRPATNWRLETLGQFASALASSGFTNQQLRPGYEAAAERFGAESAAMALELELITGPPPARHWFLNAAGDELLQAQQNWFACNWRKVAPTARYGRWDSRWKAFERWTGEFGDHLTADGLEFDQVEVTYVNHIETCGVWSSHGDAPAVFAFLDGGNETSRFLPNLEQFTSGMRYVIPDPSDANAPLGRLTATLAPAYREPGETPIFVFTLTARGAPIGDGLSGVKAFAEMAHEWIVRGFADLTTSAMHNEWQREDEPGS